MSTKEFYDQPHRYPKHIVLDFIYRPLARFQTSRSQLVCQLTQGGGRFLDIGCGNGDLLFMLGGKYRELYGVDIAIRMVERIKAEAGTDSNIKVSVQDANVRLDFENGFFDTVVAIAMLEHVFDPYSFIRECYRLLAPGGIVIIDVPNVAWMPRRLSLLFGQFPSTSHDHGWDGGHLHYFTRASMKKLLTDEGFKVVQITSCGIFAGPRRVWGSLLAADLAIVGTKP